jgi:hypothetical protein
MSSVESSSTPIKKKIGKYFFTLTNLFRDLLHGRSIITVLVEGDDVEHHMLRFYKSHSEGGFWRLCTKTYDDGSHLYKGNGTDYVQQTLAHIDLQLFINNSDLSSITRDITITDDKMFCKSSEFYKEHIDDVSRIYKIDLFDGITKCGNESQKPKAVIKEELVELSTKLFENFTIDTIVFYSDYSHIYDNKHSGSILTLIGKIYNVIIIYKEKYFELLVLKYNFEVKSGEAHKKERLNKIIPILFTPMTNKITKFGLNSKYIPSGFFVCKIMDYVINYPELQWTEQQVGLNYAYIGDILDEMPFMQMILKLINEKFPALTGGYHKKYLKYKTKYLKLKNLKKL